MPDICMCTGERPVNLIEPKGEKIKCPKAASCYRHTATPTKGRQSYFARAPFDSVGVCEDYWPTDGGR